MIQKPSYEELQKTVQELKQTESECRLAEAALTESQHRLEALSEASFEAILISEEGILLDQNHAVERMFGYTRDESVGRTGAEFVVPKDREKVRENMLSGYEKRYEVTGLRKDGTTFPCEIQARMTHIRGRVVRVTALRDITERKRAEKALLESEERFRRIFENLQDVYYEAGLDGTILEVSPSIDKLSLYSRTELIGQSIYDIYADKKERDKLLSLILEQEKVQDYDIYLKDKDGSRRLCSINSFLMKDEQGIPVKLIGSMRDNTERKRAEDSLRQVKERTETILQSIQSGVLVIDAKTHTIIDVNRAAEAMIGAGREEIVGHVDHRFICPTERGQCPVTDEGQAVNNTETVLLGKDGHQTEILKTARPAILDGRACVIESFVDISDRKRAEAAARAHQERFKTFFSSVDDAIFVHPLQDEGFAPFIEVNTIACQRYGYSRDEFLKLTARDITKKTDAERHAAAAHRKKLLDTKRLFFETVHIKKSGEEFPVEINSNIVEQYGQAVILAVVRDISERKRAEAEKARIEEHYRQAQKVESLGRLAGGVAHDLNNILTPIIGYAELMLEDYRVEGKMKEFVTQILRAGTSARDLVRQLLAFGRRQTLEYKTTDLNTIIENFESLLRRTIREDITIEITPSPNIQTIKADIGQIEQVITNLSVNAQDAMPEGGQLTLATSMVTLDGQFAADHPGVKAGPYILLTVRDNGIGMDEETQAHIFEPFFSTKGEKGTGLGLATVYGIVKQHGGNIWADSKPGEGTTFRVYLPASGKRPAEFPNGKKSAGGAEGSETILLVEDNEPVRSLSYAILKRQGYTVLAAGSGDEGLAALASHDGHVALLLTDVVMPDMNGRELFARVAEQCPGIRVLYMSGYTNNLIAHHGVLDQGVQFIQKPFSVQALTDKVRAVLDKSEGS